MRIGERGRRGGSEGRGVTERQSEEQGEERRERYKEQVVKRKKGMGGTGRELFRGSE